VNATSSIVLVAIVMMVVVMIPAIVVIVIAVRVVMMMVMMPPTVMVMVMVDQFICAGSPRMSAMGQKRKCPGSRGRSVLPTGADIVSLPRHVRLVPLPDSCIATTVSLFDQLIGAGDEYRGNGKAERLGGL
jgi:hypothetical protein